MKREGIAYGPVIGYTALLIAASGALGWVVTGSWYPLAILLVPVIGIAAYRLISLTPAMFPIILFAVRWGLGPGLMAGFVFGLLQLIFDGAYAWGWQSMLLDYLVAFTPLGLAGLFRGKKWGIFAGTIVGCAGRFLVHYISGVTIYKILVPTAFMQWTFTSPELYSIVYNGSYMLPNTIIALVIAAFLYQPMKKYILGQDIWEKR